MHILPDLEAIEEEFENNEKVLIIGVHRFFHYPNFLVYISLLAEGHGYISCFQFLLLKELKVSIDN